EQVPVDVAINLQGAAAQLDAHRPRTDRDRAREEVRAVGNVDDPVPTDRDRVDRQLQDRGDVDTANVPETPYIPVLLISRSVGIVEREYQRSNLAGGAPIAERG